MTREDAMESPMHQIEIAGVRKSYGRNDVIHGVDLAFPKGAFVVILGPSGCGKSTLLRMIAGLEEISAGTIRIGGEIVNEREPRDRGCAMVFQNYALYPHMSVAENIGYALKVAGVPRDERRRRVEKIAATVGLTEYLDRRPGQLSGGQRQRVAMGRAMIREPKVFLFDEPLSNLDAKLRVQMRHEIRRLHQRVGATSVFVTHDQIEAMTLADTLVVMNQGRVEQWGRPGEVYAEPRTLFVAGFIGSPPMNLLPATVAAPGVAELETGARVPFDPTKFEAPDGAKVLAGARPEDVAIDMAGGIDMVVEFTEEIGTGRLHHGRLAGAEFVVHETAASLNAPRPTLLKVRFDAARTHLFDPASGLRLTPPSSRLQPAGLAETEMAARLVRG
jgi:sn-glycerol 3-phosphate transport system ATP-binding protein